ncbi:hypothetical protein DPMN_059812 [Dreissena polymorpha]|uniref:Uncharacterized protein n=1 Tax=Dreissena polymorpha TaxID=45954 RepID=A0A9D4HFE2_DREPO|nr:hypothetical protein DPMN_059812 [Dreissena polymorpha]
MIDTDKVKCDPSMPVNVLVESELKCIHAILKYQTPQDRSIIKENAFDELLLPSIRQVVYVTFIVTYKRSVFHQNVTLKDILPHRLQSTQAAAAAVAAAAAAAAAAQDRQESPK